jgi:undecaprenyl-diphosphatase
MNLDSMMVLVSDWGPAIPLLCVLATRNRKAITRLIITLLLTWGITNVLKMTIARPRPFTAGDAMLIGKAPDGYSFPSQHASFSFTAAITAFLSRRALGWIALIAAALVAYSRVYLGAHYWSDVLAGAVIGSSIAYAVDKAHAHLEQKKNGRKRK